MSVFLAMLICGVAIFAIGLIIVNATEPSGGEMKTITGLGITCLGVCLMTYGLIFFARASMLGG